MAVLTVVVNTQKLCSSFTWRNLAKPRKTALALNFHTVFIANSENAFKFSRYIQCCRCVFQMFLKSSVALCVFKDVVNVFQVFSFFYPLGNKHL